MTDIIEIPDDIKTDIAKIVRSIGYAGVDGGQCFYRAVAGAATMSLLDLPVDMVFGGMVYRAGPDPMRDVVAFCGPGNLGTRTSTGILGHYFLTYGDEVVDFSAGDWMTTKYPEHPLDEVGKIQWTAPPPRFFWQSEASLRPDATAKTPELGHAWYTGAHNAPPASADLLDDIRKITKEMVPFISHEIKEEYALRERLYAVREGHTAVRLSHLRKIVGDRRRMKRDQLIVLRGKVDLTEEKAREVIANVRGAI